MPQETNSSIYGPVPDFRKIQQDVDKLKTPYGSLAGSGSSSFFDRGVDIEEYRDKNTNYLLGTNNYARLANDQSFGEKLNRTLNPLKTSVSIALGIAEKVGYLGDLLFDWDERDYTNALVEWAMDKRKGLDQADNSMMGKLIDSGEAYRKNPEKVWDLTDSSWWLNNAQELVESIGEFYVTGLGVGKALGGLAKGLAKAAQFNAVATMGSQAAAQLGTASVLAYTEGAMSGAAVYKDVYQHFTEQGMSDEEAKAKASDAAASTVQLNTILNTALNITSVSSMFKTQRALKEVEEMGLRRIAGETTDVYLSRLKELAKNPLLPSVKKATISKFLKESVQEGTEEVVNVIAEKEGREQGELENYNLVDTIFSSEAGLNFVLGAVGGIGQTAAMEHIPFNKTYKRDSEGNPIPKKDANGEVIPGQFETEFKSMSALQQDAKFKKYADYINTFTSDLENSFNLSNDLKSLTEQRTKGEITPEEYEVKSAKIKNDLFNTSLFKSLYEGTSGDLSARFDEIAKLDNETDLADKIKEETQEEVNKLNEVINSTESTEEEKTNASKRLTEISNLIADNTGVTEAMKMGLANSKEDNEYKVKALKSKDTIVRRTKMYNDLLDRFNYGDEETFNLAHYVFGMDVRLEDLREATQEIDAKINALTIEGSDLTKMDYATLHDLLQQREVSNTVLSQISKIHKETRDELEKSKTGEQASIKTLKKLQGFYKVKSVDEVFDILDKKEKAAKATLDDINSQLEKEFEAIRADERYKGHSDESIQNVFFYELNKNEVVQQALEHKRKLQEIKADYEAETKAYAEKRLEIETAKGRSKYVEIAKKSYDDEVAKSEKRNKDKEDRRNAAKAKAVTAKANSGVTNNAEDILSGKVPSNETVVTQDNPSKVASEEAADQDFNDLVKGVEEKTKVKEEVTYETASDALKAFTKTVLPDAKFYMVDFNEELQTRIKQVAQMLNLLEKEGRVADTNDFAKVCFWAYKEIGDANFKPIYNILKGVYTIIKDSEIQAGNVKHLNKEYEEMFNMFGVSPQDKGYHGIQPDDKDAAISSENETFGDPDFKIVDATNSIATKTRPFKEVKGVKTPVGNDLYEHFNPILLSGKVKKGTKIKYVIVTQELIDEGGVDPISASVFQQYKDTRDILRLPIQITAEIDGSEELLGYVHSIDYMTEDRIASVDDNVKKQTEAIVKLRNQIFNGEVKEGVIDNVSRGFLSRNYVRVKGQSEYRLTKDAILGDVEFIVFTGDGSFKSTAESVFNEPLINKVNETSKKKFYTKGGVYAVLPLPNGEKYAHLIETTTLSEDRVDTVINIIKASINKDAKVADAISKEIGEDIFTPSGLEKVINRFVFSGSYDHDKMKVSERHYLNVTPNGVVFSVAKGLLNNINKDKKSDEEFAKLKTHLLGMFFNVNTAYLTDKKFKDIRVANDGTVTSRILPYSEVIKETSQTDVNSFKIGEGQYAYFDNPIFHFKPIVNETSKEGRKDEAQIRKEMLEKTPTELKPVGVSEVSNLSQFIIKKVSEGNKFHLVNFTEENRFKTLRANLRNELLNKGIINKYNEILDYQKFYSFKTRVNQQVKKEYGFTEDIILEKKQINKLPRLIFREDYLKEIDRRSGVFYKMPDFRSVDEIDKSVEELKKSYEDFIIDLEKFSPEIQEDMVMTIASRMNQLIKEKVSNDKKLQKLFNFKSRNEFGRIVKAIRSEMQSGNEEVEKIYDKLFKLAENRLRSVYKIKLIDLDSIDSKVSDFSEYGDKEDTKNFEDGRVFKEDSKKTLSRELKTFFSFIRNTNLNSFGQHSYADFDTVYNNTKALLSGIGPDYNLMMDELVKHESNYTYMPDLIRQLEQADNKTKAQFVVDMTSHYTNFKMVFWKNVLHPDKISDSKGQFIYSTTANIIDVNRTSIERRIKEQWADNLKRLSNLVTIKDFKYVIDIPNLKKIGQELDSVDINTLDELSKVLSKLGIDVSVEALDSLRDKSEQGVFKNIKSWEGQFESKGIFGRIKESIAKTTEVDLEEENLENNSSLYDNTGIEILAREEALYTNRVLSNSFKDGEGNNIYSYSVNKYIVDRISNLKEKNSELVKGLRQIPFNATSKYLEWLQSNPTFKERFELFYCDTLNKKGRDGIKTDNQSPRENELFRLSLFFNGGKTAKAGSNVVKLINMIAPTNSDKSTSVGISTIGLDVSLKRDGSIDDNTLDNLYNLVLGEMKRIKHWAKLKSEGKLSEVNNEGFEKGGGYFYFFKELNNKEAHKILWNGDDVNIDDLDNTEIKEYVKQVINTYILKRASEKVKEWKKMSLFHENEGKEYFSFFDEKYLNNWVKTKIDQDGKEDLKGAANYIAIDYIANSIFTNGNLFQTVIGDPAMFYAGKSNNVDKNIEDTLINLGKRLAKEIAPGRSGAGYLEGEFIQIYGKDLEAPAAGIEAYRELFKGVSNEAKLDKYEEITKTDAQELVTWRTHLKWLLSMGEINQSEADSIKEIIENNLDINSAKNKELIQKFGNPVKPVYTYNKLNIDMGIEEILYNKTSAFPLIPQMTKGLEIDKLRAAMEKLEKREGKDVRFVYESGAKLGSPSKPNILNIWTEDKTGDITLPSASEWKNIEERGKTDYMLDSMFGKASKLLPYHGLRKQQEVPFESGKKYIVDGTQQRKMLFVNTMDIKDFEYKGQKYTGRELSKIYVDEYGKLFDNLRKSLINELEYNESTGSINFEKLQKVLSEEAEVRNWSINDKKSLALEYVNNVAVGFKSALWSVANSAKFESLLKSLVDNRIFKTKISGRSWVSGSAAGIKPVKNWKELTDGEKGQIVFRKGFDFEKGLGDNEILIPFRFVDIEGNVINLKDYVTSDGFIDESKLSPELLEIFGYRIPTEGMNSMAGLKIAGFLPDSMGDLMIASENLIAQTGQDFDIDKLYSFIYNSMLDENGHLKKFVYKDEVIKALYFKTLKDPDLASQLADKFGDELFKVGIEEFSEKFKRLEIQNNLIDIHLSVINHKEVQKFVKSPTSYGKLVKWRDQINKTLGSKSYNLVDPDYQRDKYISAMEGKNGIGVFALNMTLNASLQFIEDEVMLNYETLDENTGDTIVNKFQVFLGGRKSNSLNHPTILRGNHRYKSEIMSAYTTAHTDAEKMQIHSALNINNTTYSVIRILNQIGYDEDTVIPFLNLPVIREYVSEVVQESDSLYKVVGKVKETVSKALFNKYAELANEGDWVFRDMQNLDISDEDMVGCIEKGESYPNYNRIQAIAIAKFFMLDKIGDSLGQVQISLNAEAKGVGKDLIEANNKLSKVINITDYSTDNSSSPVGFRNIEKLIGEYTTTPSEGATFMGYDKYNREIYVKPTTLQGHSIVAGLKLVNDLFRRFFPYNSRGLNSVMNEFKIILKKEYLTTDEQRWLWAEIKEYLNSRPSIGVYKSEDIEAERQRLLYDAVEKYEEVDGEFIREGLRITKKSVVYRVFEAKKEYPNNKFLASLGTKINYGKPSKLIYHASIAEGDNEERIYQDFVNLVVNEDTRELAKDIIAYAYLTGGVQRAIQFIKYIPFEYLELVGYHKDLKEIDFEDPDTLGLIDETKTHLWEVSRVSKQIMQHNPQRAYIIKEDLSQIEVEDEKDFNMFRVKKEALDDFKVKENAIRPNATSKEDIFYPFVALFDSKKNNSYRLFQYVRTNNDSFYQEIPTLGTFGSSEYNAMKDEAVSLIASNNITSKKAYKAKEFAKLNVKNIKNVKGVVKTDSIIRMLRNFSEKSTNKKLANLLADAIQFKNPTLTLSAENSRSSFYNSTENRIVLGSLMNTDLVEETLLHEVIHGVTIKELQTKTPEMKEINNKLSRLKKLVIDNLDEDLKLALPEMQEILNRFRKHNGDESKFTVEEMEFFEDRKFLYFLLSNSEKGDENSEFVTGVLTSPEFQTLLNQMPYTEKRTLLEKFMELISEILSTFMIGGKEAVREDSILYEAMKQSLYLVSINGQNKSMLEAKKDILEDPTGIPFTENGTISIFDSTPSSYYEMLENEQKEEANNKPDTNYDGYIPPNIFRMNLTPEMEEIEKRLIEKNRVDIVCKF